LKTGRRHRKFYIWRCGVEFRKYTACKGGQALDLSTREFEILHYLQGAFAGGVLGALGGLAGCFGGYHTRKRLVRALGAPDIYVALFEDLLAIAGCLWIVPR
jgi:hypothetical protein